MTSQIDETVPIFGEDPGPTTASVRANFATAKAEITALQGQTAAAPFLPLAGGRMTGPFYLYNDPTDVMMPATKGYVDANAGGGSGGGGIPEAPADGNTYGRNDGAWQPVLPIIGGTLTGLLTLSGAPTTTLHAATKAYVDAAPNQAITISGDATGTGIAAIPITLATVFSAPGTFQGLTIDGKGRVTAAANQNYAPLANPAFTGTPTAPTAPVATNTTQLATTAFVKAQGYTSGGPFLPLLGGTITGALQVDGGLNAAGGTFVVGATMNCGGPGGALTINGAPSFSGTVTISTLVVNANTTSYSAINPGSNNACAVGSTGLAWNQMNSYNWFTASDRRDKIDIGELPPCLDLVRRIAPKSYRLAAGDDTRTHWGFIAQEVGALTAGRGFGGHIAGEHEALSYNDLVACLWRAVQDLADQLAELRGTA